jgi:hypothetical protein
MGCSTPLYYLALLIKSLTPPPSFFLFLYHSLTNISSSEETASRPQRPLSRPLPTLRHPGSEAVARHWGAHRLAHR